MPRVWPVALTTSSCDRFILLAGAVAARIEAFLANDPGELEAGGILLGFRRDPHIEVTEATIPSRRDLRQRHGFTRRCPSHQHAASRAWHDSSQLIDYVGEWHTHPESHPSPSGIDRTELLRRSAAHRCEPLVEIIVGWSTVWTGIADRRDYQALRLADSLHAYGCRRA